ncbi:MAG: hypothetical protein WA793_01450 [Sphingorhabdus sp.]|uniref:hypothetical protein n=1 Tax=Sphingorhabdus sp. TaxID=1902408 RepID=UPI003CBC9E38
MDMNFPHPKRSRMHSQRNGDYAILVAAAVARQMKGIATQFAACDSNRLFGSSDPVCARMNYFSTASYADAKAASGSFLPLEILNLAKVNKSDASVYPDALAIRKPYLLNADSPEQPVALRGMEN